AVRVRWKWLLRLNITAAALITGVVLLLPRWYEASAALVPLPGAGGWLDLGGTGIPLGSMSVSLGPQPTPQDELRMVVESRALADSVIHACRLRERLRTRRMDEARKKLADCTHVTTPREGEVIVSVEARSPQLALERANSYARYAISESVRLKSSLALQRRAYLQARLRQIDQEITEAGDRLRSFEEQHGAISLPDQMHASLDATAAMQ